MDEKVILLVEDSPDDVELTLRAFQRQNLSNRVVIARDGQEALDWLYFEGEHSKRNAHEHPVVVLLDLNMPRVSGMDVLKRIRNEESTRYLPVVILTSSKEQEDIVKSYDLGANAYVRKPVDFSEFGEAVRHLGLFWCLANEETPRPRFVNV